MGIPRGLGIRAPHRSLYEALAADPGFFVQVMEVTWPRLGDQADEDDGAVPERDASATAARAQQAENGRGC